MDLLIAREDEVRALLAAIDGFVSYTLARTDDGGFTVSIAKDKKGTDESVAKAREWVQANAADLGASPPTVMEGPVGFNF